MSKPIANPFELKNVMRNAGYWYVGSFMLEFLTQQERWKNPDTKPSFIRYMHDEYDFGDDISSTTTRVNAMIRIIESRMVETAMEFVLAANDNKLGCVESKINAKEVLARLQSGEITY